MGGGEGGVEADTGVVATGAGAGASRIEGGAADVASTAAMVTARLTTVTATVIAATAAMVTACLTTVTATVIAAAFGTMDFGSALAMEGMVGIRTSEGRVATSWDA